MQQYTITVEDQKGEITLKVEDQGDIWIDGEINDWSRWEQPPSDHRLTYTPEFTAYEIRKLCGYGELQDKVLLIAKNENQKTERLVAEFENSGYRFDYDTFGHSVKIEANPA